MKYKAKVKAEVTMTAFINEDIQGNQEIEDIEDVQDVNEFEIIHKIG
ncbi:hypothetical protein [Clostridium sp. AWRP]|nr:hypothetical protein [Clostridium sp. AWRP]